MSTTPIKILIADDDPSILDLYRTIFGLPDEADEINDTLNDVLSLLGVSADEAMEPRYPVELYAQGLDAVHAARTALEQGTPFTHALLDMRMPPGIDGLETAKHLRSNDPAIDITFITAYTDYEDSQIQEMVPDGYRMLQKPFTDQQILALFEQ